MIHLAPKGRAGVPRTCVVCGQTEHQWAGRDRATHDDAAWKRDPARCQKPASKGDQPK